MLAALTGYNLFFGAVSQRIRDETPDKDFNERGRLAGADLPPRRRRSGTTRRATSALHVEAEEGKAAAMAVQEMDEEDEDDEDEDDEDEDN